MSDIIAYFSKSLEAKYSVPHIPNVSLSLILLKALETTLWTVANSVCRPNIHFLFVAFGGVTVDLRQALILLIGCPVSIQSSYNSREATLFSAREPVLNYPSQPRQPHFLAATWMKHGHVTRLQRETMRRRAENTFGKAADSWEEHGGRADGLILPLEIAVCVCENWKGVAILTPRWEPASGHAVMPEWLPNGSQSIRSVGQLIPEICSTLTLPSYRKLNFLAFWISLSQIRIFSKN